MRTNTDITVYNKYTVSRDEAYQRTAVRKTAWQGYDAAKQLARGGQISDDKVALYIPSNNRPNFLASKAWQALVDKVDNWTLQNGDVVVKGVVTDEISAVFTITDLIAKYEDVLVVTSVKAHDYGSLSMRHWKVLAK